MVHVKNKGNSFEREVAKFLSERTQSKWYRVPTSGAFSTTQDTTDPRFQGDVYCDNPKYQQIVIECKSYASLELNEIFLEKSKFWKWVKQSEDESKEFPWLLFIKINRKGTYLVYEDVVHLDRLNIDNCIGPVLSILTLKKTYYMVKLK